MRMERRLKNRLEIHLFVDNSAVVICHNPLALEKKNWISQLLNLGILIVSKSQVSQQIKHAANSMLTVTEKATYYSNKMYGFSNITLDERSYSANSVFQSLKTAINPLCFSCLPYYQSVASNLCVHQQPNDNVIKTVSCCYRNG